jgi:hypothetical protein
MGSCIAYFITTLNLYKAGYSVKVKFFTRKTTEHHTWTKKVIQENATKFEFLLSNIYVQNANAVF